MVRSLSHYTKGRDLFDLIWYLADPTWPELNFTILNNALMQTGWPGPNLNAANCRQAVLTRLEKIHWNQAVKDVALPRTFPRREASHSREPQKYAARRQERCVRGETQMLEKLEG
jgi:hypothetical protein